MKSKNRHTDFDHYLDSVCLPADSVPEGWTIIIGKHILNFTNKEYKIINGELYSKNKIYGTKNIKRS